MHIKWLQIGSRKYDIEYMRQLELFLKANNVNIKWANHQYKENSRELTATERIKINIEIARIKSKWHLTSAAYKQHLTNENNCIKKANSDQL